MSEAGITHARGLARWLLGAGVLGLALVLLFYRLGDGSLYDWDEAIYAQAAKEMVLSKVWGTTTWHGYPFFHKPPLYFWLTALTYEVLGVSEFTARLWPAIFGFGVIALTFMLGVRFRSWAVGASAALLLLVVDHGHYSQWENFLSLSRVAMLDTPLTFWIMAAVVLVWEAERRPWLIALIGISAGLAVMTKAWPGFFAVAIPLVYRLLARKGRSRQTIYWSVAGLLACVIILPWHLWQYGMYGHLFLREYAGINLVTRAFQVLEEHHESPLFYLAVVRQGFSVWGYLWPLAYVWAVWKASTQGDRRAWLLSTWITIPLLLFSIAQTKLGWYISMIYPAIALLMGLALAELLTEKVTLGVVAAVMLVCCIRLPMPADGSPDVKHLAPHVAQSVDPGDTIYVIQQACPAQTSALTAGELWATTANIRAALLFSINRRLTCIEEGEIHEGLPLQRTYVISERERWPRFSHLGRVVFAGDGYILARWH